MHKTNAWLFSKQLKKLRKVQQKMFRGVPPRSWIVDFIDPGSRPTKLLLVFHA
jgi:hypothetical protein